MIGVIYLYHMGRNLKYQTYDEQLEAKRRWRREWYNRNKGWVNKKRMQKYWGNKTEKMPPVSENTNVPK